VDHTRFQEAQQAYDAGDFRLAAKLFLASAGRGADGNGGAYHMAGNSLMRLRRHQDALTVYGHALRDAAYDKRGAVYANLGTAHVALADYAEATASFESALAEHDYATPYKAYQGLAGTLLERGRVEEAAVSYRRAALDPSNPDPGKALVNLGLCFMALGRPGDAVEAYRAALGFDDYQGRGKALSNLGQAYTVLGEYEEAVRAFEKSTQLHGHKLSAAAAAAYENAVQQTQPQRETVDGWETGEIAPLPPDDLGDTTGWETGELAALTGMSAGYANAVPTPKSDADQAAASLGFGDDEAVADFFSVTDEQMRVRDRDARRANREQKRGGGWKIVVAMVGVVLAIVALGAAAYFFGFGWPTQKQSAVGMITAHRDGKSVDTFWVAVPGKDLSKEMAKVPPVKSYTVDSLARGAQASTVAMTITPKDGAPLHYTVTLAREGFGWKVTGVENDWRTSGSGK
jgi:Tfp pilus assembly protein PilF